MKKEHKVCCQLAGEVELINIIWTVVKIQKKPQKKNQKMGTICLMIAMFLNPFGYDILVKMVMDFTGSYWTTMHIFYLAAALFFGLSFYFYKLNPITVFYDWSKKIISKIKSLTTK